MTLLPLRVRAASYFTASKRPDRLAAYFLGSPKTLTVTWRKVPEHATHGIRGMEQPPTPMRLSVGLVAVAVRMAIFQCFLSLESLQERENVNWRKRQRRHNHACRHVGNEFT